MVKKRLSDLLREAGTEAEMPEALAPEALAPEALALESSEPKSQDQIKDQIKAEAPQLESTILQLKQDIEAARSMAREAEAGFNQQIAALQAKIAEQDSQIQQLTQLKTEAEAASQQANQQASQQASQQITQLKAELETARQTILQLSQANSPKAVAPARPGSSFLSRSQPPTLPSPAVLPSPRAAEPELEPSQSQLIMPSRSAKPALGRPKLHELELHKVLDHPTQPGSLPPMSSEAKPAEGIKLSETDVGWMD